MPTSTKETKDQRVTRLKKVRNLSKTCEQAGASQFIDRNLTGCALVVHSLFTTPGDLAWLEAWHRCGAERGRSGKMPGDPAFKTQGLTPYGICSLVAHALGMTGLPLSKLMGEPVMRDDGHPVRRD